MILLFFFTGPGIRRHVQRNNYTRGQRAYRERREATDVIAG